MQHSVLESDMVAESPKILCVDDEVSLLHSLERLFKDDFQVLTCASAVEALRLLDQHRDIAVVLTDHKMPGMTGVELLSEVRDRYPAVVRAILSGQMDLQEVSAAINDSDIHKFFLKPWENDHLRLQMVAALNLHRTLRERAHFEQLSITDPVTLVNNHRYFQDRLRREIASKPKCLALLMIDVDHFKSFNDRFGHPEGDRLLHAIAQNLRQQVGELGVVARYGGEEFSVILPHSPKREASRLADHIREVFASTPFTHGTVTVSVGMAMYPLHAKTADALIDVADRALYEAKKSGRNRVNWPT